MSPTIQTLVAAIRPRVLAIPSWVLVVEIVIGAGWLRACVEKTLSADWWRGESLAVVLWVIEDGRSAWSRALASVVALGLLAAVGAERAQLARRASTGSGVQDAEALVD